MSTRTQPNSWFVLGPAALFLLAAPAPAQYVGKVGQGIASKKPVLRATAVYEYTGSMTAPAASRLVPVVIWDGEHYQPGGLYLARPEPLAVAPGTQYVLEQSGVPAGLFNLASAAQLGTSPGDPQPGTLNGSTWIGLGRFAPMPAAPAAARLAVSKKLPVLSGGSGAGKAGETSSDSAGGGPVLHRKAGSDSDGSSTAKTSGSPGAPGSATTPTSGTSSPASGSSTGSDSGEPTLHRRDSNTTDTSTSTASSSDPDGPTLHRKDTDSGSGSGSGSTSGDSAGDPDRPTLHRANTDSGSGGSGSSDTNGPTLHRADTDNSRGTSADPDRPTLHRAGSTPDPSSPDPDRPVLHRHADGSESVASSAIDPDRPHLRYGQSTASARVLPAALKDVPGPDVAVGQVVAISDTENDEPHPFTYAWASSDDQTKAMTAMHALALRALASAARATFGPAAQANAKEDAVLKQAADAAERGLGTTSAQSAAAAAKPSTIAGRASASRRAAATVPDPLADPQFHAFQLSYDGVVTYIYSAHTVATGPDRCYVTVIAQPDFYGKPHVVLSQTTRGDMLSQTPALRLVDAVDANGDHRAELLFDEDAGEGTGAQAPRQFALYNVTAGQVTLAYATVPGVQQ